MTSLRLALFDCDGTLIDSQHLIVRAALAAWADMAPAPGPAPAPEAIRHVVGLSLDEALRRLSPDIGPAVLARLAERYRWHFTMLAGSDAVSAPLFPGAVAALDRLEAAGILLGIATGKSRRGLDEALADHGLGGRFVTLQTADRVPAAKPAPDMVLHAAAEAGVEPGAIVVIGDTVYDMQMARAAGARALGVAWGYHDPAGLGRSGAQAVAASFEEVPGAVERLLP
jgi:phosphoglycolate phosphatase